MAKKESLVVKSKVRDFVKRKGCKTSGGVIDGNGLTNQLEGILSNACTRAKDNNRKVILPRDL